MISTPSVKQSIVISYVFLVCAFTTVAIWHVAKITCDYLHDNRLTVVKKKDAIEDQMPFLDDIIVCLWYDLGALLPFNKSDILPAMMTAWDTGSEPAFLAHMLRLLSAPAIHAMDVGWNLNGRALEIRTSVQNLSFLVDSIISQPNSSLTILEAWKNLQPWFIKLNGFPQALKSSRKGFDFLDNIAFFPRSDSFQTICFRLPISMISVPVLLSYSFDRLPHTRAKHVSIWRPDDTGIFGSEVQFSIDVYVTIANTGCFDITHMPPCTNRFATDRECLHEDTLRVTEAACKCKLFSNDIERMMNAKNMTDRYFVGPYCTSSDYSCVKGSTEEIRRRKMEATADGRCRPCFSCRNAYVASAKEKSPSSPGMETSSTLTLQIADERFYLVYEDRPQFSLAQLTSQIGGELGLYIGFSMLSLLQFILFVNQIREERRKNSNENAASSATGIFAKASEGFRFFVRFSFRNLQDFDKKRLEKQEDAVEKIRRELAGHKSEVELSINQLREHMDKKFDEILEAYKKESIYL